MVTFYLLLLESIRLFRTHCLEHKIWPHTIWSPTEQISPICCGPSLCSRRRRVWCWWKRCHALLASVYHLPRIPCVSMHDSDPNGTNFNTCFCIVLNDCKLAVKHCIIAHITVWNLDFSVFPRWAAHGKSCCFVTNSVSATRRRSSSGQMSCRHKH